jgi:nitroreductase
MEFFDAVRARYSFRGDFRTGTIPEETLRRIVQAGLDAPSGCNFQTTEFVVVTDKALVAQIGAVLSKPSIATAPAVIVALCNTEPNLNGVSFWVEDCAAAVENVLLAAAALGYVSCWIDGALRREGRAERIGAMLGVPANRTVRILLPVGVPVAPGVRKDKKPFAQRAWFNRYG